MTIIIYPSVEIWQYELSALSNRDDVKCFPLNNYCRTIQIVLRKIFKFSSISPSLVFGGELIKTLKSLNPGDVVIVADYSLPCIYYAIKKLCACGVKINYWVWNPTSDDTMFLKKSKKLKELGVCISTFDLSDAANYQIGLKSQFYPMALATDDMCENILDFYFLGCPKDRYEIIEQLKKALAEYKTLFIIPQSPAEYITYVENIENIKKTKCIIDVVQKNQSGLSLRPLEALAYNKKLLTNFTRIKEFSFYNKNNIFILGEDKMEALGFFLNSPYDISVLKYRKLFDVNTWVDSFLQ